MLFTQTETQTKTKKVSDEIMSQDVFQKSVSTIGFSVLLQHIVKWGVIAFLGWMLLSSINQWIVSATQ